MLGKTMWKITTMDHHRFELRAHMEKIAKGAYYRTGSEFPSEGLVNCYNTIMLTSMHRIEMIDDQMADVIRSKSQAERLAIAHGLWRSATRMIHAMLCAEHPDWNDDQISRATARRLSHGAV